MLVLSLVELVACCYEPGLDFLHCRMTSTTSTCAVSSPQIKTKNSYTYTANFPIYSLVYHSQTSTLIHGGGGGPSRSGISNGLLLLKVNGGGSLNESKWSKFTLEECGELRTGDEAVMSLSIYDDKTDCLVVAGVNDRCWLLEYETSSSTKTFEENENLGSSATIPIVSSNKTGNRVSSIIKTLSTASTSSNSTASYNNPTPKPLNLLRTIQSDASPNDDGYLRVTRFVSTGRSFVAAGSDGSVREWAVPEMRLLNKVETDGAEILDADGKDQILALVASTGDLQLKLSLSTTDPLITLKPSNKGYAYKFVRFTSLNSKVLLWAVENCKTIPGKSNNNKYPRLVSFDLGNFFLKDRDPKRTNNFNSLKPLISKPLQIPKNCTCVLLQDTSKFSAFGFADGSLLVLGFSADNPRKQKEEIYLLKRAAHPFPVTGLAIDEEKQILLSSSADGLILISKIPPTPTIQFFTFTRSLLLVMLILGLSIGVLCFAIFAAQINLKFSELDDFDSFYKMFPTDQVDL